MKRQTDKKWLACLLVIGISLAAYNAYAIPDAIIGGETVVVPDPFAALVAPFEAVIPLSPIPSPGVINSVDINSSGTAIIGGENGLVPYAAFVSPLGNVVSFSSSLPMQGSIGTVAINATGAAIIGGQTGFDPYVALISASGNVFPLPLASLPPPDGLINSVDINSAGASIIGGNGETGSAFAALVSPSGQEVIPLFSPLPIGDITSVAINATGSAVIGGAIGGAYAALVSPTGNLFPIPGLPAIGVVRSVAINSSGSVIIGGQGDSNALLALISPSGDSVIFIQDFPPVSEIFSVAINASGTAIIGGSTGFNPYAAFISPSGILTPIQNLPFPGLITSVAINSSGFAIIGGGANTNVYAAFVSPFGEIITLAPLPMTGFLNSVAIVDRSVEPPNALMGRQKKNDFGYQFELFNILQWEPSQTSDVAGYFIYRNGIKIATLDAAMLQYQDHNRKKGAHALYSVTAFINNLTNIFVESTPVNVVIP
jgi:hypothetical protein